MVATSSCFEINNTHEEKSIYEDISSKTAKLKQIILENADFLICHKYGHFVIVDLLEAFGVEYCSSLLEVYVRNANKYIYLIYGYAVAKRIFLNFAKKSNDFIGSMSTKLLTCLKEQIDEAVNFNLSKNIVKACLACISNEALELFLADPVIKNSASKTVNALLLISKEVRNSYISLKERISIIFEVDRRY